MTLRTHVGMVGLAKKFGAGIGHLVVSCASWKYDCYLLEWRLIFLPSQLNLLGHTTTILQ